MSITFRNEEFEFGISATTKDEEWGLDIVVRKNATDIGFGFNYNIYNGIISIYFPFVIVNIGIPFHLDDGD